MKLQAKDLKIGMIISQGSWSMLIQNLKADKQKNGTPTIIVYGVVTDTQKNIYGKMRNPYEADRTYKSLTFLRIK